MLHYKHCLTLFKRALYVYNALVATATETQLLITQSLNETAVYKYIDLLKQCTLCGIFKNLFKQITGVAPNILAASLLYCNGKFGKTLRLEHRVAARKGDIGKRVGENHLKNLLNIHIVSVVYVP